MKGFLGALGAMIIGAIAGAKETAPPPVAHASTKIRRNPKPVRRYGNQSGGSIRRALDLRGMPAYNEYRTIERLADGARVYDTQARNAAKARRRALRGVA